MRQYKLGEKMVDFDVNGNIESISRTGYWFHVDGALGAAYTPYGTGSGFYKFPKFDFSIPEIHSISVSGHKWIGSPFPCCVYMTKVKYQLSPPDNPNYIGSPDSTFAGSRNAFSALILWDYLSRNSWQDIATAVKKALTRVNTLGFELIRDVQAAQGGRGLK